MSKLTHDNSQRLNSWSVRSIVCLKDRNCNHASLISKISKVLEFLCMIEPNSMTAAQLSYSLKESISVIDRLTLKNWSKNLPLKYPFPSCCSGTSQCKSPGCPLRQSPLLLPSGSASETPKRQAILQNPDLLAMQMARALEQKNLLTQLRRVFADNFQKILKCCKLHFLASRSLRVSSCCLYKEET